MKFFSLSKFFTPNKKKITYESRISHLRFKNLIELFLGDPQLPIIVILHAPLDLELILHEIQLTPHTSIHLLQPQQPLPQLFRCLPQNLLVFQFFPLLAIQLQIALGQSLDSLKQAISLNIKFDDQPVPALNALTKLISDGREFGLHCFYLILHLGLYRRRIIFLDFNG